MLPPLVPSLSKPTSKAASPAKLQNQDSPLPASPSSVFHSNDTLAPLLSGPPSRSKASRAIRRMSAAAVRKLSAYERTISLEHAIKLNEDDDEGNEIDIMLDKALNDLSRVNSRAPTAYQEFGNDSRDPTAVHEFGSSSHLPTALQDRDNDSGGVPGLGSLPPSVPQTRGKTPNPEKQPRMQSRCPSRSQSNSNSQSQSHSHGNTNHLAPSLADTTIKSHGKIGSKAVSHSKKKAPPIILETEEQRHKRLLLTDLSQLLQVFQGDRDILHAIVEALTATSAIISGPSASNVSLTLTGSKNTLQFLEKPKEATGNSNRPLQIFNALLDIGFELLTYPPETIFEHNSRVSIMTKEVEANKQPLYLGLSPLGTQPTINEVAVLIRHKFLKRFDEADLMGFARFLFEQHQWERFSVIAQNLESQFSSQPAPTVPESSNPLPASESIIANIRELGLRVAVINFHNVTHSERKVLFGSETVLKGTFADLTAERLSLPPNVQSAVVALLHAVSDCFDVDKLVDDSPELLLDAARILWKFIDPYLKSLHNFDDVGHYASLKIDDTLTIALRSVHVILSELKCDESEELDLAITVSVKLAILLEGMESYEEAIQVLESTAKRIEENRRLKFAEGADSISSITSDVGFHPGVDERLKKTEKLSNNTPHDQNTRLQRELPCYEVEVLMALIRCDMKKTHYETVLLQRRREEEHFRLTRKRVPPKEIITRPTELKIQSLCGANPVLKALLMAVYAADGPNIGIIEKHRILLEAVSLLKVQRRIERRLLDAITGNIPYVPKTSMICPPPTFVRRTPTSITIRPNPLLADNNVRFVPYAYQAFCKKAGQGRVNLNDVEYPGTGISVRSTTAHEQNEITISGLKPNEKYAFATAAIGEDGELLSKGIGETTFGIVTMQPLPLLLCWGKLAQIADAIDCDDVAEEAFAILSGHFIQWKCSNEDMLRLPVVGYTGVNHESTFKLNMANVDNAPAVSIRLFVGSIHSSVDRRFATLDGATHADSNGSRSTLTAQLTRLEAARDLLVAVRLAQLIEDRSLVLRSALKLAAALVPIFQFGLESPFAVHAFNKSHSLIIEYVMDEDVEGSDRNAIVRDMFIPMTFYLSRRFMAWKEYSFAIRFAEESIVFLNNFTDVADLRIMNSMHLEHLWTGYQAKTKSIKYAAAKKSGFSSVQQENVHHVILALSKHPNTGYNQRRRSIDVIYEHLECVLSISTSLIRPIQPSDRRLLDIHTTLKDLYAVLSASGIESVLADLGRFKKNPRYLEVVTRCAKWALDKGLIDLVARVCCETFEWLQMRNRYLQSARMVWDESLSNITKDVLLRKKRKNMFADRKAYLDSSSEKLSERKSR
jgi:hypothetical protein